MPIERGYSQHYLDNLQRKFVFHEAGMLTCHGFEGCTFITDMCNIVLSVQWDWWRHIHKIKKINEICSIVKLLILPIEEWISTDTVSGLS